MPRAYAVITAIGTDRVGIVDDLAGAIAASTCNIEESKMSVLGGEFAVIMLVSGAPAAVEGLTRSLSVESGRLSLRIECKPTREPAPDESGRPYLLEAVSLDTPGIVHSVTAVLRAHGINIEELETDTAAAPWTGAPMFRMKAHVIIGPAVQVGKLKEELSRLQDEHDLDIVLKPVFALPESE
jgi:glycine cleavage system transcriptional repressor